MHFDFSFKPSKGSKTTVSRKANKTGNNVTKVCKHCGKTFVVANSYGGTKEYCSIQCAASAKKVIHTPNIKCAVCGAEIYIKPSRLARNKSGYFTCSKECMGKLRSIIYTGANNPNYRNESISYYDNNGIKYQKIKVHNHPYADKYDYYPYHRYVVEQNYNRFDKSYFDNIDGKFYLKRDISVHHINKDTLDNKIENLIPLTKSEHTIHHNLEKEIIRDNKGRISGVFKRGELLENHNCSDNQQPSINSNINKGSTTNSQVLPNNVEDGNANTSALPTISSDDIV